jgi:hypothetical protein
MAPVTETSPSPSLEERVGERRPLTVFEAEPDAPAVGGASAAPKPSERAPLAPAASPGPEKDIHSWLTFPELCSDHGRELLRDFFER